MKLKKTRPIIPTTFWLALFPLTYLIHFAEELWGGEGYPAYLLRLRGVQLSETRFITWEIVGLVLITTGCVISRRLNFAEFMIVMLGGLVLANGISHSLTAIWDGGYGPGLLTSAFLWIPLGILTLVFMYGHITNKKLTVAALIGFGIQGIVALIAIRGGRLA